MAAAFKDMPVVAMPDCPVGRIYFLPSGSTRYDPSTGRTTALLPGVYVNPKTIGVVRAVTGVEYAVNTTGLSPEQIERIHETMQ